MLGDSKLCHPEEQAEACPIQLMATLEYYYTTRLVNVSLWRGDLAEAPTRTRLISSGLPHCNNDSGSAENIAWSIYPLLIYKQITYRHFALRRLWPWGVGGRGSGYGDNHYRASKSVGNFPKQWNRTQSNTYFTMALSSRLPRQPKITTSSQWHVNYILSLNQSFSTK